ncbi:unnamed protein product [Caenorhabditis bovis]|uniref:Uncharacterized protein n=1 Tax=Caenorhabditis bovis TaxID=2654633 RepID=A0A8S1ELJ3_9PELO|nr:unnamed protein product [Caenorhabditis bovis]
MMGIKTEEPSGPSAPAAIPDGDNGWDYDEGAAPGLLPEPHFIQSTYIYRCPNELERNFANRVVNVLRTIRENLAKHARLTIENENIECSRPTDHYRCAEYPTTGAYNYLIIEDDKSGASVYTFERKYNEKNDETIEMALLDAYSRHAPRSLIPFATEAAEKHVGYIRALSVDELATLGKTPKQKLRLEKFGPNELRLIDTALLEVRTGEKLGVGVSPKLLKLASQREFDKALEANKHLFVLFWNFNRMVSLHTFELWSRVGDALAADERLVMAHVACHDSADFCHGLNSVDFQTIVAYRDGQNIGKTDNIGDVQYYLNWIEIMLNGPLIELKSSDEVANAKKGKILDATTSSLTLGIFRGDNDTAFQHFQIAASKLAGKYYLCYHFADETPSLNTYRPNEKQKRANYDGKFDPATMMAFITQSSLPNMIDISHGFTTDVLLRRKHTILIEIAPRSGENEHFAKLAARQNLKSRFVFTRLTVEPAVRDVVEALGLEFDEQMVTLVALNKDRVHKIDIANAYCADHLLKLIEATADAEPYNVISTKRAHPLRILQKRQVDEIFGHQDSIILPDHTLFLDSDPFAPRPTRHDEAGGCPFMRGQTQEASLHDEL